MILIDSRTGSKELFPIIKRLGVPCELVELPYGDFAMEGNGPSGRTMIGVERKALHDMLHCIEDSRYSAHQRPGMAHLYKVNVLMVEGVWSVGTPPKYDGQLMQQHPGMSGFIPCSGGRPVLYSKLYRYLISVALTGVIITYPRNIYETAYQICEWFHWFSKSWSNHTSMQETQKFAIPSLMGKPSLVRRWANDIEDVGVKLSMQAEQLFKTPIRLATAGEMEWVKLDRVGAKTAMKIVREINGL